MPFSKVNRPHSINGIIFTSLFAAFSFYIANLNWVSQKGFSPLVVAIVLGMIYGSTFRPYLPTEWNLGIQFISKRILRLAIVLYGFRLTFQEVIQVGVPGLFLDVLIVGLTLFVGAWVGRKIFKLDKQTALLISSGAAICGAAAVLATEGVLKNEAHKTSIAVLSVVLFGTIAMFLYPFLQHLNLFGLSNTHYAIYAGATIHEVAQVLIAGTNISPETGHLAVVVKMTRVILLAPTLFILNWQLARSSSTTKDSAVVAFGKMPIPWFAVLFIVVIAFNSLHAMPSIFVSSINALDTFLLTLAMAALGMDTNLRKIGNLGLKPLYFSFCLFLWLLFGGYGLAKLIFYYAS